MLGIGASTFLQALGWTVLNSFWQIGLLWALYSAFTSLFKPSSATKYKFAAASLVGAFVWSGLTFYFYYQSGAAVYPLFATVFTQQTAIVQTGLLAASVTYLLLLFLPSLRLFQNWRKVQQYRTIGLQKAPLYCRLFVQNTIGHLGIRRRVQVVLSTLVTSPLTVGFLKPMILLPVAVINGLSQAQVEAILIHELAHIRRFDYFLNLVLSFVYTLLYFNPFARFFMDEVESERESCCDQLVVQFGYNRIDYASALLQLQKASGPRPVLFLAAAGRKNLLHRIENITGMKTEKKLGWWRALPIVAALICVVLFNSVLIINDTKTGGLQYTADVAFMPWQVQPSSEPSHSPAFQRPTENVARSKKVSVTLPASMPTGNKDVVIFDVTPESNPAFIPVDFDAVEGSLSEEDKQRVKEVIDVTKKAAGTLQWHEIEKQIGDAMTKEEKELARQDYVRELSNVNWKNVEQNLKANYEQLNWQAVQQNVASVQNQITEDSLRVYYKMALTELEKLESEMRMQKSSTVSSLPDASLNELQLAKETLRRSIDSLTKKIIRREVIRF